MSDQFISESIQPIMSTLDTKRMASGEPGLPHEFRWRKKTIAIEQVLQSWHETKKCRHGSAEVYVRKHWYKVRTAANEIMKIYFDRQPNGGRKSMGWWLFSIQHDGAAE